MFLLEIIISSKLSLPQSMINKDKLQFIPKSPGKALTIRTIARQGVGGGMLFILRGHGVFKGVGVMFSCK